ncbi:ribosome production factor 2 homolog [Onthophagus taurus]|uniref:ribosome production factor 2 homolog n=1 Tax=Onthophagus taurus TaxID=166361 RepID=UPI0039BE4739
MSVMKRVVKSVSRKGKKVLLSREPQLVEGPKRTLFLQGRKTSDMVRDLLKDMYNIKKPDALKLSKKNDVTVFENINPLEQLCKKHEASLFVFGSHNKKRPDNITFGRMFDYNLLDMIELGIEHYMGLNEFPGPKITLGTKPCLIFNGEIWDKQEDLKHLKSIFVDMFRRETTDSVRLQGLEHAISFNATNEKVFIRSYRIVLKKSGCKTPRIELDEIGPRMDFTIRRSKLPTEDLMKQASKKPKELKEKPKKNISIDKLGTKHGRIHVGKQEIAKIQVRKMKGLKKTAADKEMGPPVKRNRNN